MSLKTLIITGTILLLLGTGINSGYTQTPSGSVSLTLNKTEIYYGESISISATFTINLSNQVINYTLIISDSNGFEAYNNMNFGSQPNVRLGYHHLYTWYCQSGVPLGTYTVLVKARAGCCFQIGQDVKYFKVKGEKVKSPTPTKTFSTITPTPNQGTLTIASNVGGYNIYLNGTFVGVDNGDGIVTINLVPGSYNIVLQKEGCTPVTSTAIVMANTYITKTIEMICATSVTILPTSIPSSQPVVSSTAIPTTYYPAFTSTPKVDEPKSEKSINDVLMKILEVIKDILFYLVLGIVSIIIGIILLKRIARLPSSILVFFGYTFLIMGFFLFGILELISFLIGLILLFKLLGKNKAHALIISYNSLVILIFYLAGILGQF